MSEESVKSDHSSAKFTCASYSHSTKVSAAAEVAALEVKLRYVDVEIEKKKELKKLKATKELEMAKARLLAIERSEETLIYEHDLDGYVVTKNKQENVAKYISSLEPEHVDQIETIEDQAIAEANIIPQVNPPRSSADCNSNMDMLPRSFADHISLGRLPLPEPGIFSGDPLTYPGWKSAFETLIEKRTIPQKKRIYYLKRYLSGPAKQAVEGYFLLDSEGAYQEAKSLIDKRFGNPFVIANAFREKLEKWPKIQGRDGNSLRKFSDFLRQCLTAMEYIDSLSVLNDDRENQKLLTKLPDWIVHRWSRIVSDWRENRKRFPPFRVFVSFVAKEAEIACDPVTDYLSSRSTSAQKPMISDSHAKPFKRHFGPPASSGKSFSTVTDSSHKTKWCFLCNSSHDINQCKDFLDKSMLDRKEFAKEKGLCFACLKQGHLSRDCPCRSKCDICARYHPTAFHGDSRSIQTKPHETKPSSSSTTHLNDGEGVGDKCSMIVPVWLFHKSAPETERLVYALLDTQSDTTFVLENTLEALEVTGPHVKLKLSTMTSADTLVDSKRVTGLQIRGFDDERRINLPPTYSRELMPANRHHIPTPEKTNTWPHLQPIAGNLLPLQQAEIGLLIGYNCSQVLTPREVIAAPDEQQPFGQKCDLGWGIVGIVNPNQLSDFDAIGISHGTATRIVPEKLCEHHEVNRKSVQFTSKTSVKEIKACDVNQMMELDFSDHKSDETVFSLEERRFLDKLREECCQLDDKHYEMPLPFKGEDPQLPNNRFIAEQRLSSLKRRFQNDVQYRLDYIDFMQKIVDNGFAEPLSTGERNVGEKIWYIPHHGVYHAKKPQKIRVVFDCSSQYQGTSLNDHLLKGPEMTNTLLGVLCRFRKEPIAIQCDIEQMFYQFRVAEHHRDYLRFLWWENGEYDKDPIDYRMTVHLFGAASSPGCANFGLRQIANDFEDRYGSKTANFIRDNFYVDDGLISVETVKEGIELVQKSKYLCSEGGVRLHKFTSNSMDVMNSIPEVDRAKKVKDIALMCSTHQPLCRALGVHWCISSDSLQFRIMLKDQPLMRRTVLSTINSIYDPLGLIAPVVLKGKQILQEMCKNDTDWDDPLSDDLRSKWEAWRKDLFHLESLKVSRCYKPVAFGEVKQVELHHFSDACTKGYGQCTYLRLVDCNDNVHCAFVMGKSRVTPLRSVTIPRLELTAAVISVRISQFLSKELKYDEITETYWTDSKIVLGYIGNASQRFHIFVANRVQLIHDRSSPFQWRHVKGDCNPADIASRGSTAKELLGSSWLTGPSFLWDSVIPEPENISGSSILENDPEVRKVKTHVAATARVQESRTDCIQNCSSWYRTQKAIALCLKWRDRHQAKVKGDTKASIYDSIDVTDMKRAEALIVKMVQCHMFPGEMEGLLALKDCDVRTERERLRQRKRTLGSTNRLCRLDPFVDSDGVMRVGGRVGRSSLPLEDKHPMIIPRKHHVTSLVIRHFHEVSQHQGRGLTVNSIRSNGFWIIGCGAAVSSVIYKCVKCRKYRGKTQEQKMADLPKDRVAEAPPFSFCGVDVFGPFIVKEGRRELKRYGSLFTCLACRAIHIEILDSLSTDSFINCLRRFIAIRGPIRKLRCDRGTNFVGASRELEAASTELDMDRVRDFLLRRDCDLVEFEFNVPSASHMGGVWERLIRTVRSVLTSLMSQASGILSDESLRTFMCEAMAIVNSRPLSVDNLNDPTSLRPLTPNQLLTLKTDIVLPPPGKFQRCDMYSRKHWRRVQHLANEFLHRWRTEFLHCLQSRQKWIHPMRNLRIGDIVLIKDDNLPRGQWRLGRVIECYSGEDNLVRKVKLDIGDANLDANGKRTGALSCLERPIHKLVLILESEDDQL